jgi:membrane protease YdiL (CAAX protease family)
MELNQPPRAAESNGRLAGWLAFVGAMAALGYASRFAPEDETDAMRDAVYEWGFAVLGAVQYAIMLLLILWIAAGPERRELLGLRRPRSWPAALGLVLGCWVAVFAAAALLEPILHAGEEQGLTPEGWDSGRAAQFAANAVVIALVAPIVEELLFRGIGFALLLRFGRTTAILASGGAFGLVHGLVGGFVILALFGVILSWLRNRTDSVLPTILLHAVFNAFALLASVLAGGED